MAAGISVIVIGAVYAGISNTFSLLNVSRENLRATQIIMSRMEALRLEAWGSGTNQPTQLFSTTLVPATFTDYFYPAGLNNHTNDLGTIYTGTVTITTNFTMSPACSYGGTMAMVTVTLNWTDIQNGATNNRTSSMSTLVAQNGIRNYVFTAQ